MTRHTRKSHSLFGSVGRCLKGVTFAVALLLAASSTEPVQAAESYYKVRVHRNLIQKALDANFPVLLQHIQGKAPRDIFLSDVDASLTDVRLQIKPDADRSWDHMQTDVFFDQGQIVAEVGGLHYEGTGTLTDPSTGIQETVRVSAPLDLVQLVLSLE